MSSCSPPLPPKKCAVALFSQFFPNRPDFSDQLKLKTELPSPFPVRGEMGIAGSLHLAPSNELGAKMPETTCFLRSLTI